MNLETVLIIGFGGILFGVFLLLFTDDNNIYSFLRTTGKFIGRNSKNAVQKYQNIEVIGSDNNNNNIDARIFSFLVDTAFIGVLLIIHFQVINGYNNSVFYIIILCVFCIPFLLWNKSIGEKFLHIEIYKLSNERLTDPIMSLLRYFTKIVLFPLNLITLPTKNVLIEDLLFKTFVKQN